MELLTLDSFKKALPKSCRNGIGDDVLNYVNGFIQADPELNGNLRNEVMSYVSVLQDGRYKIKEYVNAVRYIGFKLAGDTNIAAFVKTFPERYQRYVDDGTSERDISSAITCYKNGALVCKIFAQTLTPTHIINHDIYQEAINTQADLMRNARSEQVRMKAADSLIQNLKAPEIQQIELSVGVKEDPAIDELRETTRLLVLQQKEMHKIGALTIEQIAHSKIIPDEVIEGEIIDN